MSTVDHGSVQMFGAVDKYTGRGIVVPTCRSYYAVYFDSSLVSAKKSDDMFACSLLSARTDIIMMYNMAGTHINCSLPFLHIHSHHCSTLHCQVH